MKKYAATILVRIRRENCEMLHWSKTRGRPQEDASTHESLSGANKRTATEVVVGALWAKSELIKKTKRKIKMELVFTSVSGQLHVLYLVLCSHKRMNELGDSYDKGATQRDRLLIIDWRTTAQPRRTMLQVLVTDTSSSLRSWSQVQRQQQPS